MPKNNNVEVKLFLTFGRKENKKEECNF